MLRAISLFGHFCNSSVVKQLTLKVNMGAVDDAAVFWQGIRALLLFVQHLKLDLLPPLLIVQELQSNACVAQFLLCLMGKRQFVFHGYFPPCRMIHHLNWMNVQRLLFWLIKFDFRILYLKWLSFTSEISAKVTYLLLCKPLPLLAIAWCALRSEVINVALFEICCWLYLR